MSGDCSLQLLLQNQALRAFIFSSPFAKAALLRKTRHFFLVSQTITIVKMRRIEAKLLVLFPFSTHIWVVKSSKEMNYG
jgi:hypothetical protein